MTHASFVWLFGGLGSILCDLALNVWGIVVYNPKQGKSDT